MKKLAVILGSVCGLFVVAVLAVEFLVDLNAFKPQITTPMEEALDRKVELGDVSLSLFQRGAKVRNITIFEHDQSNIFVQVKDIVAQVKLLPLMSKKIEVATVLFDQPTVTVTRNADGGWNFDDLLGQPSETAGQQAETSETDSEDEASAEPETADSQSSAPPETEEQPAPQAPPTPPKDSPLSQFALDTFQLRNGAIRFVDDTVQVTTELNDITGNITGIAVDSPIEFELAAIVNDGKQGNLKASGKVGPIPADFNMDNLDMDIRAALEDMELAHFQSYYQQGAEAAIRTNQKLNANLTLAGTLNTLLASNGNVSVGDVKMDVSGTVEQAGTSPKLDLTVSLPDVPWDKVLELLPPDVAAALEDLNLSGLGNITIQPKGTLDQLVIAGEFDLSKSGLQYQTLFAKPEALKMALTFNTTITAMNAVEISTLALTLGELELNVSGTVENFAAPELDLQIASNAFPLDKLMALFPDIATPADADIPALSSGGTGQLSASVRGMLEDLAVQANVNLDQADVEFGDLFKKSAKEAGNLTLVAHLGKDALTIEQLLLHLGRFELSADGRVGNLHTEPTFDMRMATNEFEIAGLLAQLPVASRSLPPELTLSGLGQLRLNPQGSINDLTVSGALDMSQGEIVFGELFNKPADMPGTLEFDATLKEMDAVEIRKVRLNLNDVILDITGMITDLQQEAKLDLRITSNQFALNQLSPLAAGMGIESSGTTALDLTITTSVNNIDPASLITGSLRLNDVGIALPQLPKPVRHLNAGIQIDGDTVRLEQFSAAIGESSLAGHATVSQLFGAPVITFDIQAPVLNLDELMPPAETARRSADNTLVDLRPFHKSAQPGLKQHSTAASFKLIAASTSPESAAIPPFLQQLTATGTLKVTQGVAKNVHFSNLTADVDLTSGVLQVENLFVHLYDGTYEGFARLDLNDPDPIYEFQSKLVHVDANPALKDNTSIADVVYGFVFADAAIQGQGFTMDKLVQTLSGKGAFTLEEGKIATLDIWPEMAVIFQTLGSLAQINELTKIGNDLAKFPAETPFSRLAGSFQLKNGEAGSSDLIVEIPTNNMHLALLLEGSLGLDTALDFIGRIRFDPKSKYYADVERNFRDFKQADGSIELPFPIPIGGTLLKPEFSRSSIQQSLAAFGAELAKQMVKKEVENQVIKLLQDALPLESAEPATETEQPTAPSSEEPTPTPKPEEILEEVGKDLLKNLFK